MIHVLNGRPSSEQIAEMLEALEVYIKLTVDVATGEVAGGGTLHADCEAALFGAGQQAGKSLGRGPATL